MPVASMNLASNSVDSSPVSSSSTSSSSSYHQQQHNNHTVSAPINMEKNLINLNDPMSEKINSIKALSRDLSHQMTLSNAVVAPAMTTTAAANNSNDMIFKYPNDNEYIYSYQHQQHPQHQRSTFRPKQSDFYYHVPHPADSYFQPQLHQQQQQRPPAQAATNPNTAQQQNRTAKYVNPASIETPI